ncbi:MAG: oligoendopeptidase F [Cyclobacteriaceae bacterium]|nr:oligoendopeptidase F [Cyclobacteriaceae bacterium]
MIKNLIMMMIMMSLAVQSMSQMKVRAELDDKYKWNLKDLYDSDEAWTKEKDRIKNEIQKVEQFKGTLTRSGANLLKGLEFITSLQKELYRLNSYAAMSSDEDTRVTKYQGMKQELGQIGSSFAAAASFMEPEILATSPEKIREFVKKEPGLKNYDFYLEDLLRKRAHKGSEEVEKVIAHASLMAGNASSIYSIFFNAEFPFPEVTLTDGEKVKLNYANFAYHRAGDNRENRVKVFETFFSKLDEFQRTFGTQLYGNLKRDVFYARARNYESTLASALDSDNIPLEVYHNLIENVNKNLDTFHRYLNLRKRIMGLESLHYYDLYAPLVQEVDLKYNVEDASQHILASLKPLGADYVSVVDQAFKQRWIDMYPNEGKRTGAYSNGSAYDVHPYILMNYNGKYDDVSTLTHELGHTMHSYLANKAQPFSKANYPIFVAEVASTLNEALLNDYLLGKIDDDKIRLSILGNYLEGAKGTLFRQTQFAEFELLIHEKVENGEALTGERFNELYLDITRRYYGHDKGVCIVDDYIQSEWAFIPHFYYNYYVYQYATSFTASQALAEKVMAGNSADVSQYLSFLSAGGSKYPVDLLMEAGVDMKSAEPFDLTIGKINKVMDEMEDILKKMGK